MPVQIVGSPCIGVCCQHPKYKVCRGCYRSRLELRMWQFMTLEEKVKVIDNLELRKTLYGDLEDK